MPKPIRYLPEELAWLELNKDWPRKTLHSAFVVRFMREDVVYHHITSLCKRRGWRTGRTGCFPKGQVPFNKGKKMPFHAASAATQFNKGQRPLNKQDVGYETTDRDGYVMICIAETNPWTGAPTRMYHKHRYLWEQLHGKVPKNHVLKCLDAVKANCDPKNWECLPKAMMPRLNGRLGRGYDAAPDTLKPTILATAKLEHAVRMRKLDSVP